MKNPEEMTTEEWIAWRLAEAEVPKFIVVFDSAEEWGE